MILKTHTQLENFFDCKLPKTSYSFYLEESFARKIKKAGPSSALWKQFIPSIEEESSHGLYDPIGDLSHKKTGQLVHRYKNRVLFLPTSYCPIVCRYCFRKNEIAQKDSLFKDQFEKSLNYLREHKEINEVIFSGGDPFVLPVSKIENYLESFYSIDHIDYVRFHTRMAVTNPEVFNSELINLLSVFNKKFKKIILALHINHLEEIDSDVLSTIKKIQESNIKLITQTVLLKGVNDNVTSLKELFSTFSDLNLEAYYLHHPDKVQGGMHFYLSHEEGKEIFQSLRKEIPGWQLPRYVFDSEDGKNSFL